MEVVNYTSLRSNLKKVLDSVIDDHETVIINRGSKSIVMIPLEEFNSWQETMYLLKSKNNRQKLEQALERDREGVFVKNELIQ
jgi:antitoxin YefM